jgi:hypothetical protein
MVVTNPSGLEHARELGAAGPHVVDVRLRAGVPVLEAVVAYERRTPDNAG